MKTVVVGFSKPRKWKPFSWLIMTGFRIPYSHTYIRLYSNSYNRFLIYQASSSMVNFMNVETFDEEAEVVREFDVQMDDETYLTMVRFAIDNSGKAYGVKECFGLAYVRIMELFGKTVKNPYADGDKTWVCSALISEILRDYAGQVLAKDPDDMTPLDVFQLMLSITKSDSPV